VPYRAEILEFGTTMKSPEYLAINPMGKVPAIRHGERVVTECAAICSYLADVFPEAELGPLPDARADYYRWLFFAAGGYIAGDRFSAVDVFCGAHIGMGMRFGYVEERPAFVKYWALVSDRDAYRRATELDDALMPKST
jgi:glutathione S-transferase